MKKYLKLIVMMGILGTLNIHAQVGMSTNNPNPNAVLDLNETDGTSKKGLLLPKVVLKATNNFFPLTVHVAGMKVYNTATDGSGENVVTPGEYNNDGTKWVRIASQNEIPDAWNLGGNTNGTIKELGTKDAQPIPFITNGTEKMRLTADGRLGIGTNTPLAGIHLKSNDLLKNDVILEGIDDASTLTFLRSTTTSLVSGTLIGQVSWLDKNPEIGLPHLTRIASHYRGPDLSSLQFTVSGSTIAQMTLNQKALLGLGTTTPGSKLHLYNENISDADDDFRIQTRSNTYTPSILIDRNRTDGANLINNDVLGSMVFRSYLGGTSTLSNLIYLKGIYKGDGTDNLASLTLGTSGLDRMTINENGNVGIGIKGPVAPLHVDGKQTLGILINNTNASFTGNIFDGTASADGVDISNNSVRIQKGSGGSGSPLILSKGNGYSSIFMTEYFVKGARVGSVTTSGTSVTYNTTSDMRLKENIKPTHYGLSDIMKIKVNDYNYKTDEKKTLNTGFLAQELYKIYPQAVTVGGENEKTDPWQIDYSKLTPLLLKAIQDQQMQIEALKNKLEVLEAKR